MCDLDELNVLCDREIEMGEHLAIAIDGPAGAGKSTVAKALAKRMNLLYIDSGAMYRAVSWLVLLHDVNPDNEEEIMRLLLRYPLRFQKNADGLLDVFTDEQNINDYLRSPHVSDIVSTVSAHAKVRDMLTDWQRKFAQTYSVVMDGRDIGSVVLPNADVKVFLTANLSERAERRKLEFAEQGFGVSREKIVQSMIERDERDSTRKLAPLRQAPDAILIDSSGKTVTQVVEEIVALVRQVNYE